MMSAAPTLRNCAETVGLAFCSASSERPYRMAMPISVSPRWTMCVNGVGVGVGEAMMTGVAGGVRRAAGAEFAGIGQSVEVGDGAPGAETQAVSHKLAPNTHIHRNIATIIPLPSTPVFFARRWPA
jgi:hypothetical protein